MDTVYFTLQKHKIWPLVVTEAPHTMKPEVGPVFTQMHSRWWRSPGLCHTCVCPSLAYKPLALHNDGSGCAVGNQNRTQVKKLYRYRGRIPTDIITQHHWYRQNLLSSLKTTDRHSTFESTLSWHQSSHAGWCHGGTDSLARGTWSESCCKQTVPNGPWWHSRCNMCLDFFPECCLGDHCDSHNASIWCAPILCGCPESGLWVWNVPQITAESSDTQPIHCAQHVQQSISM